MRVTVTLVHVPWRAPLHASHGGAEDPRPVILLSLTAADGTTGFGEAAPLAAYDGVSAVAVLGALEACRPLLEADAGFDHAALLSQCAERTSLPQAIAAIDLALWDLAGQLGKQPVWALLGAEAPPSLLVNATIGAGSPEAAVEEARQAVEAGFSCVKVKVGTGEDVARLAAVRASVGPDVAIRIDANGAWPDVATAAARLAELESMDIEICEEPIHGAAAIAALGARTDMALALDESALEPAALERRSADAVCLKIGRCGGITGLLRDAAAARALGYEVYLASTLDGPLGIAAALHAVAAVLPDRPCGLATLGRFAAPVPFSPSGGRMLPPAGDGLGYDLAGWYWGLRH